MDARTFDRASQNLAGSTDRRSVLRQVAALAAVAAGAAGAVGVVRTASADRRHGNNGNAECVKRCLDHGGNRCHTRCRRDG